MNQPQSVSFSSLSSSSSSATLPVAPKIQLNWQFIMLSGGVLILLAALHLLAAYPLSPGKNAINVGQNSTAGLQTAATPTSPRSFSSPADFPAGLYPAYLTAQQNEGGAAYYLQTSDTPNELTATNPAHNLQANFSQKAVTIAGVQFALLRVAYAGQAGLPLDFTAMPVASANRVDYNRGAWLGEWYLNGPLGVEQGFTLKQALPGPTHDRLEVELGLSGVKAAHLNAQNNELAITLTDGKQFNYGGLYVYDAAGKTFPANFELIATEPDSYRLILAVSGLTGAVSYPLTVDPLFGQAQFLISSDGAAVDNFGWDVALSADGNTAIIGAWRKTIGPVSEQGAAYVFTRSGVQANYIQAQILTDTNGASGDGFGYSVALSADGNTALVGSWQKAVAAKLDQGVVFVYARSGIGANYSEVQTLTHSTGNLLGNAVALTNDGNTAFIGASATARVVVFTRTSSLNNYNFSQLLTGISGAYFGESVALAADGNTALIGSHLWSAGGNSNQGAAYIFTRSNITTPYVQTQVLTSTDGAAGDLFGQASALSGDGTTALIGAYKKQIGANTEQGAAYVFTRSMASGSYSQTQIFTDTTGAIGDNFGYSVALSTDGNMLLIGSRDKKIGNNNFQGAFFAATRAAVNASYNQPQIITAVNGTGSENFGYALALTDDGHTALVGAYGKAINGKNSQGAAYVFKLAPTLEVTRSVNPASFGENVVFTATVTSSSNISVTGDVTFYVDNSPAYTATLTPSGVLTYATSGLAVGNHTIFVRYNGGSFGQATSSNITVTIVKATPAVVLEVTPNPATYSTNTTFTATVTPAVTGTVTFAITDTNNIGKLVNVTLLNGLAVYMTNTLVAGNYTVTATYNGNVNYTGSLSNLVNLTITKAATNLTLASDVTSAAFGTNVTFTATTTPVVTGTVTFIFTDTNNVTKAVTLPLAAGTASYMTNTLAAGSYSVTATYNGNNNYNPGVSNSIGLIITKITTTLNLAGSAPSSIFGNSVTFTATVTPPAASGVVTFTFNGITNTTATLAGGIATYATNTLPVGVYSVTAIYGGAANYAASSSNTLTHTVLTNCNPLLVTALTDNGQADTCGTLSYALLTAGSGVTITFALSQGNTITFTSSLTPTVKAGVVIDGGVGGVTLNGGTVAGDGLVLTDNNRLLNLTIRGFGGRGLVAKAVLQSNQLYRVKVLKTP